MIEKSVELAVDDFETEFAVTPPPKESDVVPRLALWLSVERSAKMCFDDGRLPASEDLVLRRVQADSRLRATRIARNHAIDNGTPYARGLLMHFAQRVTDRRSEEEIRKYYA
ncbi:MAG: hypothetical protein U5L95_02820 [Candidatus Saccharibacteria bacterium]|nr:hypothetical protein [Candidatus Saccharibacteria bacterium]